MSTTGSISSLSNLQYIPPTTSRVQSTGGDSDGDSDGSSGAGRVGKGSNFMQAIEQALGKSLGSSSTTASSATTTSGSATTQDPVAAVQAFMQSLFSALHQGGGSAQGSNNTGADKDGDNDASRSVSGAGRGGSNMAAKIQNLLQQLSANSPSSATGTQNASTGTQADPLSALNSSFQNMLSALNPSQGAASANANANAPSLQSFLQNLMQNLGNGQNIAGAVVSTHA